MKKREPQPDDAWVLGTLAFIVIITLIAGGFLWLIAEIAPGF